MTAVAVACSSGQGGAAPPYHPGDPLTLDVSSAFAAGTTVRDRYRDTTATVSASGTVTVTPDPSGVVLLEKDGAAPTPFDWADATVYFVMTDRFFNGDPSNDTSYGRAPDGASEVGTWHGGDLKGLTAKLDYIASLGATAIWITPIVEQVHGWVAGGAAGDFKHYGYHGYWGLDFTRLDQNLGSSADLQDFVDQAHQRGIRVLVDVVMNHPGYATGDDLLSYLPEVFTDGTGNAFRAFQPVGGSYSGWTDLVDYTSPQWVNWWASTARDVRGLTTWIRAGFPSFPLCGGALPCNDFTRQLSSLPDFITEGPDAAGVPILFTRKADTGVVDEPGFTVRQYLVKWHTDWVQQYGIDGFRCDTVKHVEFASWKALKDAGVAALGAWKADPANAAKKLDDSAFWMTGEVFPHGVVKDGYYTFGGFDSLINFEFQPALASLLTTRASLAEGASDLESLYASYAAAISGDPTFDALSYISSHDTSLFYATLGYEPAKQRQAGTALLLAPGGVQVFYGDESGRRLGPSGSDATQGTRSDMNWSTSDASILAHFQKLGTFRKRHAAVGAGTHQRLASPVGTYAFARKLDRGGVQDAVVVILTTPQ
jgi:alpha-amylase